MALASGAPAHAEPNHYARNDDYRDFGELWILLSALEHFQRDGDKLRSISSLLQSVYKPASFHDSSERSSNFFELQG